jgi:hypothetical protein
LLTGGTQERITREIIKKANRVRSKALMHHTPAGFSNMFDFNELKLFSID